MLCSKSCTNYPYFGLENGGECYCGTEAPVSVGQDLEFTKPCSGDSSTVYGDQNRGSVYKQVVHPHPTSQPSQSLTSWRAWCNETGFTPE